MADPPLAILDSRRSAWFPDTPAITEIIKLTPEQETLMRYVGPQIAGSELFYVRSDIPKDRLEYLQQAFAKVLEAEGFVKQTTRRFPIWADPLPPADVEDILKSIYDFPGDGPAKVEELVQKWITAR